MAAARIKLIAFAAEPASEAFAKHPKSVAVGRNSHPENSNNTNHDRRRALHWHSGLMKITDTWALGCPVRLTGAYTPLAQTKADDSAEKKPAECAQVDMDELLRNLDDVDTDALTNLLSIC